MTQNPQALPLAGITVLDLSRVLAGPFATLLFAQLGARILKVEMPECGDDARAFGPFVHGKSLYFAALNYDKESIALNLKQPADRDIFEGLLSRADVLVENFRPGTMEELGYGWDALHPRFPNLIYGAASGFGHTGPYSNRAAYDMVVQGMGGIMSMTGQPGSPPTRVGTSIGDLGAALYLTIGLLSALWKRAHGGGAVKVDVAMLDCQVALQEAALTAFCCTGAIAKPEGSRHREIAPFQVFKTQDAYLVLAAGNDRLFAQMASAMDRPDLVENPNYKTNSLRRSHLELLEADMERSLRTRTTAAWLAIFNEAGVPCGPVNTIADVARDPQVAARNMILSVADPVIGDLKVAGNPIKLSGIPERASHRAPPAVDADRDAILGWIQDEKDSA
jgi:CoA:oxalate CoA-transferase